MHKNGSKLFDDEVIYFSILCTQDCEVYIETKFGNYHLNDDVYRKIDRFRKGKEKPAVLN